MSPQKLDLSELKRGITEWLRREVVHKFIRICPTADIHPTRKRWLDVPLDSRYSEAYTTFYAELCDMLCWSS